MITQFCERISGSVRMGNRFIFRSSIKIFSVPDSQDFCTSVLGTSVTLTLMEVLDVGGPQTE